MATVRAVATVRTVLKFLLCNLIAFGFVSGAYGLTIPASEDTVGYLNKVTAAANAAPNLMVDATHTAFLYFTAIPQPEENEFLKVISQRDNGEI